MIAAIIKDSEKKARDAETAARRHELTVRREQARKQREQERIDKRAEYKRKEKEKAFESLISLPSEQKEIRLGELANDLTRTLPSFATISQHLWACKAGLHQRIHGMSNSGPIRSRLRRFFRRRLGPSCRQRTCRGHRSLMIGNAFALCSAKSLAARMVVLYRVLKHRSGPKRC